VYKVIFVSAFLEENAEVDLFKSLFHMFGCGTSPFTCVAVVLAMCRGDEHMI
jgi:hypothetical protein